MRENQFARLENRLEIGLQQVEDSLRELDDIPGRLNPRSWPNGLGRLCPLISLHCRRGRSGSTRLTTRRWSRWEMEGVAANRHARQRHRQRHLLNLNRLRTQTDRHRLRQREPIPGQHLW